MRFILTGFFAFCVLTGCTGKSFEDILSNPTPQEEDAFLATPPLVIPPNFRDNPLMAPRYVPTETRAEITGDDVREAWTQNDEGGLVPLPTPFTGEDDEDNEVTDEPSQRRPLGRGNDPLPTLDER